MKNPVVKSSNPAEVQLVVNLLVREINALEDQIKLIKAKTDQRFSSTGGGVSASDDATLSGL